MLSINELDRLYFHIRGSDRYKERTYKKVCGLGLKAYRKYDLPRIVGYTATDNYMDEHYIIQSSVQSNKVKAWTIFITAKPMGLGDWIHRDQKELDELYIVLMNANSTNMYSKPESIKLLGNQTQMEKDLLFLRLSKSHWYDVT